MSNDERTARKFSNLGDREWLSLQQAAVYAGFSEGCFCRHVRAGTAPPSIKLGNNARRFRRADIDRWIEKGGPSQKAEARHVA
jgi:predicted DNA-binding transcriptional regulator AlpA